ncbi:MAG: glycosyltransferase [Bacteroidales bacterium]|uniref:glycosyltransferase family 2 protein n=1 Tax=Porphyromonas sp. TaxID=1924944 RepID=UPI0029751412|nr:glycosyltransferase [Porphyromonas sp.]MDD7438032.1 glycosyltransferase [Bacteroidales bacterium]MDY3067814.1 glycosyltransferase [Porphyromonas sp.]
MPKISIIIPVYNVERYLRRCLNSVANQTFADWEAICVNDGSPDRSALILEEYAADDPRFKIITKENGGLSDARNVGMSHTTGDYIMYLDSDDLIHPQTMEIALQLAQRDGSDIVSWYKDPLFRPQLLVMAKLGFNVDNALPRGINKRFELSKVRSYVTDDVFAHVTEYSKTNIKHPIKHFYVWRHLIKRELVADVPFIKGLTFEDFPWWSEVILKNPRVTITNLPFYYYFPNFGSIDLGSKQEKKILNWITGLEHSYKLYEARATEYQKAQWSKNCMWAVIVIQIAKDLKLVAESSEAETFRRRLRELWNLGVFDHPTGKKEEYNRLKIKEFIESTN